MIIKAKDLRERGLPDSKIRQFCHMSGSPFFQTGKCGTWWVETKKFDAWLDELSRRKEIEYG